MSKTGQIDHNGQISLFTCSPIFVLFVKDYNKNCHIMESPIHARGVPFLYMIINLN